MSEVERRLQGALVPVEPSIAMSDRLERRLTVITDAAIDELAEFDPKELRDPRRWGRLVAAGVVGVGAGGAPSSSSISCSCLMARWMSTFAAPSERSSARAISRLSIPSAKRMISASRRSSCSRRTPSRIRLSSSRPSTSCSVVCGALSGWVSSIEEAGRRERSR